MKKVCVMMSTYNGEKYLAEQLDSLLFQKNVELFLFVRDDGSKDNTASILLDYQKKFEHMSVFTEKNVGVFDSFMTLLYSVPNDFDYYAFCDQDDVWDSEKLYQAVSLIENNVKDKPCLYYSNLDLVDSDLNLIGRSHNDTFDKSSKFDIVFSNYATGCTMVFNNSFYKIVCMHKVVNNEQFKKDKILHDEWICALASFFSYRIYDNNSYIKYRQHSDNVIGMIPEANWKHKNYFVILKKALNKSNLFDFIGIRFIHPFYEMYYDMLSEKDKSSLEKLFNIRNSFQSFLRVLFDRHIFEDVSLKERFIRKFKIIIILVKPYL